MVRALIYILFFLPLFTSAQNWNFGEVKKLSAKVNSRHEEGLPLISPDGNILYFTRSFSPDNSGGKFTGPDVWISRFDPRSKEWGNADNKTFRYNTRGTNAVVGISNDGNIIYLINNTSTKRSNGIFFSKKTGLDWSKPEFIPVGNIQTSEYLGLYVSPDFDVIILSMKDSDGRGEEDLYVSLKNGKGSWSKPKNLGPTINTTGFEISPFLSADKNRLFFSSNGHSGFGDADIFYCDRLYDSWETWSVPKNLGQKVNSTKFDAYFSMYGDSIAYFTSNRSGDLSDIYSIKINQESIHDSEEDSEEAQQQFLSSEEVDRISGQKLTQTLYFNPEVSELTNDQMALLTLMGQIFSTKPEFHFHLMAHKPAESVTLEIYQKRLINILNQLKKSGIQGFRITLGIEIDETQSIPEKGRVDLLLFKRS